GGQQEVVQEVGSSRGETLVEGLRRDRGIEDFFGSFGVVVEGGVGVSQQGEDQGLCEDRAAELASTLAEKRLAGEGFSGGGEQVMQDGLKFCYTQWYGRLRNRAGVAIPSYSRPPFSPSTLS